MDELTDGRRARLAVSVDADAGESLVVRLGGDLDLPGVTDLTDEVDGLLARDAQPVLLDLADVAFCDSQVSRC